MRRVARRSARAAMVFGVVLSLSGSTPAPAAPPGSLARYFPRRDLVAYAEFGGLDNHADLWRKTAAYRVLNETTTGAMLEDAAAQLVGRALASTRGTPMTVDGLRTLARQAARSGFAIGVVRKDGDPSPRCVGVVLRGGAGGKSWDVVQREFVAGGMTGGSPGSVEKPGGRKLVVPDAARPDRGPAWWREGDDLAVSLASPQGADLMIEALDGRQPGAADHPEVAALARVDDGFTPVGFAFLEPSALGNLPPWSVAAGLDKVTRFDYRWGFQGEAVMTVTRATTPAPRPGLLALFDQPTFDRKGLHPLPPGLGGFTTVSVDVAGLFDRVAAGFASSGPQARAAFESFEKTCRDVTGQRLRDDILVRLGPKVTYYTLPGRVDAPSHAVAGLLQGVLMTPAWAVVVDLKDAGEFAKVFDDAVAKAGRYVSDRAAASSVPPGVRVNRLKGVDHGFVLSVSPTLVPLQAGSRPTLILGKTTLVIGSTTDAARGAIALQDKGAGLPGSDALSGPVGRLPGGLIFAHVGDARRSLLPELVANAPGLIQWYGAVATRQLFPRFDTPRGPARPPFRIDVDPDTVPAPDEIRARLFPSESTLSVDERGVRLTTRDAFPVLNPFALAPLAAPLLLPAYRSAGEAANRAQSVNHLKQIGLAFHNYHSTFDRFPPGAIADKAGKPLLSWRVAILPYIEEGALYNEFKLDEPWDSPHNKPLLARMPRVFAVPGSPAGPGNTFYRGFRGPLTMFDPKLKEGVSLRDVTDGTSNTIAVVEAKKAVPWTKPDEDIPFGPAAPAAGLNALIQDLGGHFSGGFDALFVDGSVRFIKQSVNGQVLRALITRAGGEVVSADSY